MKLGRLPALLVAVGLVVPFGYRAIDGIRVSWLLEAGTSRYRGLDYEGAVPLLERAAVGAERLRARRLAAEACLEQWERQIDELSPPAADRTLLVRAARGFLECRCIAPASRRSWEGLAEVYDYLEWTGRERRSLSPFPAGRHPWSRVGRAGRISVGMIRGGLELAPHWYLLLDDLAITLWSYGLEPEAREAVRASALSLPLYVRHTYDKQDEPPAWLLDVFTEASRETVGRVPLLSSVTHWIDLGKLELRRGNPAAAARDLARALSEGADSIERAEARYHLGLALFALGRDREGRANLEAAVEHPALRVAALRDLARAAERAGDLESALAHLRRLRQEQPRDLVSCLEFARVAAAVENWPAAIEALSWARIVHPRDPRPHVALATAQLAQGDVAAAAAVLRDVETWLDAPVEAEAIRREIAAARER